MKTPVVVIFPGATTSPVVLKFALDTLPVTLTLDPVITPPTVEAAVCVPVTLVFVPK